MACIRLSSTIALCSSHQRASSASFSNFGTFGLSALLAMSVQSYLCQILFSKPFVRFESRYWLDGFPSHLPDDEQIEVQRSSPLTTSKSISTALLAIAARF